MNPEELFSKFDLDEQTKRDVQIILGLVTALDVIKTSTTDLINGHQHSIVTKVTYILVNALEKLKDPYKTLIADKIPDAVHDAIGWTSDGVVFHQQTQIEVPLVEILKCADSPTKFMHAINNCWGCIQGIEQEGSLAKLSQAWQGLNYGSHVKFYFKLIEPKK